MMSQPQREPAIERPKMPDGYGVPASAEGALPWAWAVERLQQARNYWFSTTRPDGRPHAMPAWAVWLDDTLYFEGSPLTRRARNLAGNPSVVVHLESGDEVVILEGVGREASPPSRELAERLAPHLRPEVRRQPRLSPQARSVGPRRPVVAATHHRLRLGQVPGHHDTVALGTGWSRRGQRANSRWLSVSVVEGVILVPSVRGELVEPPPPQSNGKAQNEAYRPLVANPGIRMH